MIILVPLLSNAQSCPAAGNVAGFNDELREVRMFDFDGSPFYENEFVEGKVTNNKGESEHLYFRYNVMDEVFHIKKNLNSSQVYELPDAPELSFSTKNYKYLRKDKNSNLPGGNLKYVIEFRNEENYHVLGVPMIEVIPAISNRTPYHSTRNGKYKIVTT